ncbi:MAG: hypothetical protein IJM92_05720 [Fibrobacter sp.]|uniref:hypothetical protein n=1 Tax=Fibrobacter sp. TaxID=35828 RepID=UPI0025BFD706|nr:hypothetical protein [Fibrobacter sp.]MBQ7079161.1 hypothetical protein [Fibrobacter sp.]
MNNFIKLSMVAGILVTMGCSDNNVSGAAIEGNAVAQNSSSSDGASNSSSSSAEIAKIDIKFSSKVTSSVVLDRIRISVFGEEEGTSASCSAGEKSYAAKMKVRDGIIEQFMELKNFGSVCDSVLEAFVASCPVKAIVYNEKNDKKACDEKGSVTALCHDARAVPLAACTNTVPGSCATIPADTTVDFNEILNDFVTSSGNMCNALSKEGGDDIVAPDSISFTLDEYTAQFTDDPEELLFDSHVLAYNGPIPFDAIFVTDGNVATMTIPSNKSVVLEVHASEIPRFFPKMSSVAKDKLQKDGCKTYVVTDIDAGQPTGHVLTSVSKGTIEITSVIQGGLFATTNAYFPVAFLVQDCDGLIDENSTVTSKVYTSKTWCNPEKMASDYKEIVSNPDCKVGASTYVSAYGEWIRADLIK